MGSGDLSEPMERYNEKWMDLSLTELENFAKWMNDILGYHPTIIGGWAVYFYNPSLGSIDIDVVLPSWEMRDRVINKYLKNNGYELREKAFGEEEWVKFLEADNQDSETYLDVCTRQDKNMVHGRDIEVPWSIAFDHQREQKVKSADIFIPDPEPLLILKVKAAWDRNYDIEKTGGSPFLKDKVKKDRWDILSLLSHYEMDQEIINEILLGTEFKECFNDALGRAISDKDILNRLGFQEKDISNLKNKVEILLANIK
jgi:hypothetical protein